MVHNFSHRLPGLARVKMLDDVRHEYRVALAVEVFDPFDDISEPNPCLGELRQFAGQLDADGLEAIVLRGFAEVTCPAAEVYNHGVLEAFLNDPKYGSHLAGDPPNSFFNLTIIQQQVIPVAGVVER